MPPFDTLQAAKDLESSFTPEQAEALVKVFARSLTEELVTKGDFDTQITLTRADFGTRFAAIEKSLDSQTATLRLELKDVKGDMIKWIAGALLVNFLGVTTLIKMIGH